MKKAFAVLCILIGLNYHAIGDTGLKSLENKIDSMQTALKNLKAAHSNLQLKHDNTVSKLSKTQESLEYLKKEVATNGVVVNETTDKLDVKISNAEASANKKINQVDKSLNNNTLIIGAAVLLTVVITLILYRFLSKQQKSDKSNFETHLKQTKDKIEEEQVQINTKLAELYNGQMEMLRMERKGVQTTAVTDHSLALKVADEIVKMQMNLSHMDPKVRGHRQLSIAVSNVFDNFRANGYEITDLLNKPFVEGMNIDYTIEPDPNLKENEKIISRVIKPEVLFNNEIIQNAKVIVSFGE